jgi:hypothetical protein
MAKVYCKFALLLGLTLASVPGLGMTTQAQQKDSEPQVRPVSRQVQQLPEGGSELPLLSVIGLGILSGGILSAMRTRPSR